MPRKFNQADLATSGGLAAIFLWSTTVALARSLSEQLGPLTAAASVYLVGGLFCLSRLYWRPLRHYFKLPPRYLLGCGSLFVLYTAFLFLAVGLAEDRSQVLEVGLINYLWPALTILLSLWLLNKRPGPWLIPGTAISLLGVFLVMTQGTRISWASFVVHVQGNPWAYAFGILAAVSWALYSNLTRRWSQPNSGGAVELFIPITGLVLLALSLGTSEPSVWNMRSVWEILFLGLCTALAYAFWDVAMRKGNLLLVVVCSYFTPLLSTLVTCIYLGVMPGAQLWLGCLLVVIGSLVTRRSVLDR